MLSAQDTVFVLWCRLTGNEPTDFGDDEREAFLARPQIRELARTALPAPARRRHLGGPARFAAAGALAAGGARGRGRSGSDPSADRRTLVAVPPCGCRAAGRVLAARAAVRIGAGGGDRRRRGCRQVQPGGRVGGDAAGRRGAAPGRSARRLGRPVRLPRPAAGRACCNRWLPAGPAATAAMTGRPAGSPTAVACRCRKTVGRRRVGHLGLRRLLVRSAIFLDVPRAGTATPLGRARRPAAAGMAALAGRRGPVLRRASGAGRGHRAAGRAEPWPVRRPAPAAGSWSVLVSDQPATGPIAARKPNERVFHDDLFVDEYEWLRDKANPEVLDYLRAENAYTEARTADLAPLQEQIFDEIVSRTKQTDLTVPVREGEFWYYTRTVEGQQYRVHCRLPATGDTPPGAVGRGRRDRGRAGAAGRQRGRRRLGVLQPRQLRDVPGRQPAGLLGRPDRRRAVHPADQGSGHRPGSARRGRRTSSTAGPGRPTAGSSSTSRSTTAWRPYQVWRHPVGHRAGR